MPAYVDPFDIRRMSTGTIWFFYSSNAKDKHGSMGLLPDKQNCGWRMSRECRERFPRHRLQRKPLVSEPGMHHGTCVTMHIGNTNPRRGKPVIPGACATRNFAHLVRGPWQYSMPFMEHEEIRLLVTMGHSMVVTVFYTRMIQITDMSKDIKTKVKV